MTEKGYTTEKYIEGMKLRENEVSTYIGNGVAIPHGILEAKKEIIRSGLVVVICKNGIDWSGEKANLIIGIAGLENEHLGILAKLAVNISDESFVKEVIESKNKEKVYNLLAN